MPRLAHALAGLRTVSTSPPRLQQSWRYLVRQRLTWVADALAEDAHDLLGGTTRGGETEGEPWLQPRLERLQRDGERLRQRVAALAGSVCEGLDLEAAQRSLTRLVADLEHYQQRRSDVAWDAVDLDVGGSD